MENCKAAQFNPKNACTDRCKWPGACINGRLSVVSALETVSSVMTEMTDHNEAPQESVDVSDAAEAKPAEPAKRKGGRPRKVQ